MSAEHAVEMGRRAAERLMTDTVTVGQPGAEIDPLTGENEPVQVYEGKAKLNAYSSTARTNEVVAHTATTQTMMLHFPVGVYRPQVGDIAQITSSRDPQLVGLVFRVIESAPVKTFATSYRVSVEHKAA